MRKKTAAAWLLTAAMTITMCSPAAVQAEGLEDVDNTLIAEFDFNTPAVDGSITGKGAVASVKGNIQLQTSCIKTQRFILTEAAEPIWM